MERHPTETEEQPKKKVNISFKIVRSFALDVLISETIESIKGKVRLIEEASIHHQDLFFNGNYLEDYKTVSDYIISTDSTIDVHVERRMQILIEIPSMEKTSLFVVECEDTVLTLKVMIEDEVEISLDQQLLVFNGKSLKDDQELIACGVRNYSTIYVMLNPLADLLLYVQMPTDDTFSLEVVAGYTIKDVKVVIQSLKGIPARLQKLLHDKVELQDSFTLSFYKILHKSVIQLQVLIDVFVEDMTEPTLIITAEGGDTIALFKSKIVSKRLIKMPKFHLEYAGKILDELHTLAFYGIHDLSTVLVR